jgi:uncharacterized protein (DUF2236 family)
LLREAILLTLHPAFAAAAIDHDSFNDDPVMRFKRVAWYAYGATYGSKADAEYVSGMVRRRHMTIVGDEPLTRLPYRADSQYELALTQAMLTASFLAAYEELHGELSTKERDQYIKEQQVPAALLGVDPKHLPSTYGETVDFLAHARNSFTTGLQAREILSPFANGEYPRGTAIGDLPPIQRRLAMFGARAAADMAMLIMNTEERELVSINRRPKLGSKVAVRASFHLLSRFLRSEKGMAIFNNFLGERIGEIFSNALEADAAPGGRTRAAQFQVPDAASIVADLPDLVENWPGSTENYAVGIERELSHNKVGVRLKGAKA